MPARRHDQHPAPDMPGAAALRLGIAALGSWMVVQFVFTLIVVASRENATFDCTLDLPRTELVTLTALGLACLAAAVLTKRRNTMVAALSLGLGAGVAIGWIAAGGFEHSGCVIGV